MSSLKPSCIRRYPLNPPDDRATGIEGSNRRDSSRVLQRDMSMHCSRAAVPQT